MKEEGVVPEAVLVAMEIRVMALTVVNDAMPLPMLGNGVGGVTAKRPHSDTGGW